MDYKNNQRVKAEEIDYYIQQLYAKKYKIIKPQSVRSIEDFAFFENEKIVLIDVKSHSLDREYSMPNLISVPRLLEIYKQDIDLRYVFVSYDKTGIKDIKEYKYYELDTNQIRIGNLENGQLQITKLADISKLYANQTKDEFIEKILKMYDEFCIKMINKFVKQRQKIKERYVSIIQ